MSTWDISLPLLLKRIRSLVYLTGILLALAIYFFVRLVFPSPILQEIRLTQMFGLAAIAFLYLSLLASPLYVAFPNLPSRVVHLKARKALGICAFFFALIHGAFAFFFLLGGFSGLGFLNNRYLLAISVSSIALFILLLLAVTSPRFFHVKLGRHWKTLHRFVYLAGLLIIAHALMLGTHYADPSGWIPQISFLLLAALLLLEANRFDRYASTRFAKYPRYLLRTIVGLLIIFLVLAQFLSFPLLGSLNIHGGHK